MKIYTSYFYQIRFFKPYMLPLSTACFDPKWFNNFCGQGYKFLDKRNVINGLRAEPFVPNSSCNSKCRGTDNCVTKDPRTCEFLGCYYNQLKKLPIESIKSRLESLAERVRQITHFESEPVFVFIVHEAAGNPCSERYVIQKYFMENGINCTELSPKDPIW